MVKARVVGGIASQGLANSYVGESGGEETGEPVGWKERAPAKVSVGMPTGLPGSLLIEVGSALLQFCQGSVSSIHGDVATWHSIPHYDSIACSFALKAHQESKRVNVRICW